MIVFDLICNNGHRFESWFQNGAAFDRQQTDAIIECPFCGTCTVNKAPMAPRVAHGLARSEAVGDDGAASGSGSGGPAAAGPVPAVKAPSSALPAALMEALQQVRRHVEANCDYVGSAFAEEARRIYYREAAPRSIYGESTPAEAAALDEEGIEVQNIPWLPRRNA